MTEVREIKTTFIEKAKKNRELMLTNRINMERMIGLEAVRDVESKIDTTRYVWIETL